MASNDQHKTDVTRKYVENHKDMQTRTLARLLTKDWPEHFHSLENARCAVRRHRGNIGDTARKKHNSHKENFKPNGKAGEVVKLPKSKYKEWEPFEINHKRNLILADIHIPYHDDKALSAALKFADGYKPDAIILDGDIADFFSISRFNKNPKLRDLPGEIIAVKQFLDHIKERFSAKVYYKLGNHEERYEHYLWQRAEELLGVKEFELKNLLMFDDSGVVAIEDQRIINLGQLPILHGHEFIRGVFSPVNAARGLFLKAKHSCMGAHQHHTSEHTEKTLSGKIISCWSVGCLCGLSPDWAHINRWNHGFATVDVRANGDYYVNNYRILNGRVLN